MLTSFLTYKATMVLSLGCMGLCTPLSWMQNGMGLWVKMFECESVSMWEWAYMSLWVYIYVCETWINTCVSRWIFFWGQDPHTHHIVKRVFNLGTINLLDQVTICGGGSPVHCSMLSSIPGLYTSVAPSQCDNQKCLQTLSTLLLVKNH